MSVQKKKGNNESFLKNKHFSAVINRSLMCFIPVLPKNYFQSHSSVYSKNNSPNHNYSFCILGDSLIN